LKDHGDITGYEVQNSGAGSSNESSSNWLVPVGWLNSNSNGYESFGSIETLILASQKGKDRIVIIVYYWLYIFNKRLWKNKTL
jgi:hypothetical protein